MSRVIRTFMAGFFVLLPILLTIAVVMWAASVLYGFLGPGSAIGKLIISLGFGLSATTYVAYLLGVITVVVCVYLLGLVVQTRLKEGLRFVTDSVMYRIPLVSSVYDIIKRLVALVDRGESDALKGMRPIWCFFGGEGGAAVLGLLPAPETITIGLRPYHGILVPSAPVPVGGCLIYVPAEWVKPADIGLETLMNIYVSMGVTSSKMLQVPAKPAQVPVKPVQAAVKPAPDGSLAH
jgi:uncharacterized membrane protein